ncbi:MAG TPA: hypothetical protein VFQ22_06750, partial [Longimicrobiales bacterium]|nr:hypothetical protein [Longimicrobiales bacterium]
GVPGARRRAFLLSHRPDLRPVDVSGRSPAELHADPGGLAAVVVSSWEARIAGLSGRVAELLDPRSWLPEPGQGIVALVARHPIAEATALDHLPTRTALRAELALLDALGVMAGVRPRGAGAAGRARAGEGAPAAPAPGTWRGGALGSLAQPSGRLVRLWAAVVSPDGRRVVRADLTGPLDEPELLGAAVARQLVRRGADLVLAGGAEA